jgi:hypothetical protein
MRKILLALALIAATTPAFAGSMEAAIQPNNTQDKNTQWNKYVLWVGMTSAKQYGKAQFTRSCQPEMKVCIESIWYLDKNNVETMAREGQDINGNAIQRDVCRFNKSRDVRTCVDWYSEAVTTEMKNGAGEWKLIQ